MAGPDVADTRRHCVVQLQNGKVLMIGSVHGSREKEVKLFDPETNTFTDQEDTNDARDSSGCTVFKSDKHGGREVVYVGGGHNPQNSAEILDYTNTETWERSKIKLYGKNECPLTIIHGGYLCPRAILICITIVFHIVGGINIIPST